MGMIYVLLLMGTAISATNGLCLPGDTEMCHDGHPLIVGGRLQPLTREGESLDPFWNNEGRKFVFLRPPGGPRKNRGLHGGRGIVRVAERTACSGEGDAMCPIPATDVPCEMSPADISAGAPLVFSNITSTGLTVSWDTLHEFASRRVPPIFVYILRYREASSETPSDFKNTTVSVNPSLTMDNLKPDTLYEFQLVPESGDPTEKIRPSGVQTVRTLCGVPPTPVFAVFASTSRSLTFFISPYPSEDWKCSDQTTTLQALVEGTWENVRALDNSDMNTTVEDLTPCTGYSYRLKVSNVHETAFSPAQETITDAEGLGVVLEPVGESLEPGALNVSWTPPAMHDTSCVVSRYRIEYVLVSHKACSEHDQPAEAYERQIREVSGTETSVLLTDLVDFADYNVSITPIVGGERVSVEGEMVWFIGSTTTAAPTGFPDGVVLDGVSQSHLTFSWSPPVCTARNGDITGYSYVLEGDSAVVSNGTVEDSSVRIEDLDPDSEYTFSVAAQTSAGDGPPSQSLTEATRSRGACRGKHPLRLGGVLTSLSGGPAPWGSGQPIFVVSPHHLSRHGRRFGHSFGGRGIIRITRSERGPCDGSPGVGSCPTPPEIVQALPGSCSASDDADMTCEAAYPKFSYEREDVISFEPLSTNSVKVTWRDWEVTKDKGVGPVTGYVLRHRRQGDLVEEIHKGLSVHHTFSDLAVNEVYEFEVVPLKNGVRAEPIQTKGVDTYIPLPVEYVTGCGVLRPVQNISVVSGNETGSLVVRWDPPDVLFCPIVYYNYTIAFKSFKACPDHSDGFYSTLGPAVITNETSAPFFELHDFAEYIISVTPVTAELSGEGYMYGEATSIVGTTSPNVPEDTPEPTLITTTPRSAVFSWDHPHCSMLRGTFIHYAYSLRQGDDPEIEGTTQGDTVEIADLIPCLSFTFRLQMYTTGGSAPPRMVSGLTEPSTPLSYSNLTSVLVFEGVTASSVTLSWPEWSEETDNGTGMVENYVLRFGEPGRGLGAHVAGRNLSATVHGLDPDTEYNFQIMVIGRCSPRQQIPSEAQRVWTICGVPDLPRLTRYPINSPVRVIFNVQVPGEEGWACREMVANIQEVEEGEWIDAKELDNREIIKGGEYNVELPGPVPCSKVAYRIKMVNTEHTVYSEPVNFTMIGVLNPVRNLRLAPTENPGELYVDWEEPEATNCPLTSYTLEYHKLGDQACGSNFKEYINGSLVEETHATISDLEPYIWYTVEVAPKLRGYAGRPTAGVSGAAATRGDVPMGVLDPWLGVNASSIRELTFSWLALPCERHRGGNITYLCELFLTNAGNGTVLEASQVVSTERCTFEDLKACGNYSFTVTPGNTYGLGNASYEVNARIPATALGPVENISTVARPNGEVYVQWERDEITSLCPVRGYTITPVLQRQQACRVCVDLRQPPIYPESSPYVLQNLKAFATYKINISVQMDDDGSQGLVLKEKVFTTMSAAPTEAPVAWEDDSLRTDTSLTFRWNTINCTALNGIFKQYTFRSNATNGEVGISNRRRRVKTLKRLKPCTTYAFHIRVMNSMGGGPFGTAFGTTTMGKPGRGCDLRSEIVEGAEGVDDQVLISWHEPTEYACPVDAYTVIVSLAKDPCEEETGVLRTNQTVSRTLGQDVTGIYIDQIPEDADFLMANALYNVGLRPRNSVGEGEEEVLEVAIPESVPTGFPTNIVQYSITGDSVTISWGEVPCRQRNGVIVGYEYELRGDVNPDGETSNRTVTLTGLGSYAVYDFRVRAKTSAGYGPFSRKIEFITSGPGA